jgi:hypothetical protein
LVSSAAVKRYEGTRGPSDDLTAVIVNVEREQDVCERREPELLPVPSPLGNANGKAM